MLAGRPPAAAPGASRAAAGGRPRIYWVNTEAPQSIGPVNTPVIHPGFIGFCRDKILGHSSTFLGLNFRNVLIWGVHDVCMHVKTDKSFEVCVFYREHGSIS